MFRGSCHRRRHGPHARWDRGANPPVAPQPGGISCARPGYDYADVVKTTVLLQDIADFGAMNAVYAECFTKDMPARMCYQVARLPMGALVEIDAVAVK